MKRCTRLDYINWRWNWRPSIGMLVFAPRLWLRNLERRWWPAAVEWLLGYHRDPENFPEWNYWNKMLISVFELHFFLNLKLRIIKSSWFECCRVRYRWQWAPWNCRGWWGRCSRWRLWWFSSCLSCYIFVSRLPEPEACLCFKLKICFGSDRFGYVIIADEMIKPMLDDVLDAFGRNTSGYMSSGENEKN